MVTVIARAALTTSLVLAVGCGGDSLRDPPSFRFTQPEPGGVVEVYRNGVQPFEVAWETDADEWTAFHTQLILRLDGVSPVDATHSRYASIGAGAASWSLSGRPGTFRLSAELRDENDWTLGTVEHSAIVIAQGIELRDAELTFTAATTERDIWVQTSTASVMVVDLVAMWDGAPTVRHPLGRATVASDLAPVGRVFAWDETLPAGGYTIAGDISAAGDTLRYSDGYARVTWTP
jgi:hypothetical protein